jgi:hypothetical protein
MTNDTVLGDFNGNRGRRRPHANCALSTARHKTFLKVPYTTFQNVNNAPVGVCNTCS